jgi:hypothetical protein
MLRVRVQTIQHLQVKAAVVAVEAHHQEHMNGLLEVAV